MSTIRTNLLTVISCAAIGVLSHTAANAQAYKAVGGKPTFDDLPSPEFSGGKQKSFKPKDWLEIEASIKLSMSPVPPSQAAERILVKWYVAVENPDKRNTYLLLTKDITHVNVPLEEEVFSSVYLSPSSVKRLTGSDGGGKRAVFLVGYEVLVNGKVIAAESNKQDAGWWNQASDRISQSQTVPLLDKSETAFSNMWWDRYAEILVERR